MNNKRTHQYPKTRKPRDISYSKSYKILQLVGEEELKLLFSRFGMYTSAKILSHNLGEIISPYVVRHLRKRYELGGQNE
ncbi:MAG: hypothetical protein HYV28_05910 [Ignavibacteriales bacterium]|nr:hypothetical protein [Ignavibacteriales bacterium]